MLDAAAPHDIVVYDGTTENPTEGIGFWNVLSFGTTKGCDGVIALGGGSPIDLSKAVGLIATHGGKFSDYDVRAGGSEKIGKIAPPKLLFPPLPVLAPRWAAPVS